MSFIVILLQKKVLAFKKLAPVCFCFLASIILWAATTGHGRYAIALEPVSFIIIAVFIFTLFCAKRNRVIYYSLAVCVAVAACMSLRVSHANLTKSHYEWSWRPSIFTDYYYLDRLKPNLKLIFNDRNATDDPAAQRKLDSVKTWVCLGPTNGYPVLANPASGFFCIYNNKPESPEDFTGKYFETHPKDGMHALISSYYLDESFFSSLDTYGFVITAYERLPLKFADANDPAWFFTLTTKEEAEINGITGIAFDANVFKRDWSLFGGYPY